MSDADAAHREKHHAHADPAGSSKAGVKFAEIRSVLATDCGSTTTKAILIEKVGDTYRLVTRGEAPTTVEAPFEDVTKGVFNAVEEVEELRGRKLLDGESILRPQRSAEQAAPSDGQAGGYRDAPKDKKVNDHDADTGVDIYISTSSAGGGLQMVVAGVVANMTTESATRAALGAGAIVMDSFAINDGRLAHEKIERIRQLRPDMILLAGGVDGGTEKHVVAIAEMLSAANPRPRLGIGYDLPVVYAGNKHVRTRVSEILAKKTALQIEENVRPTLEEENLLPARERIHDLFLEHVMAQAPGYRKLMDMTDAPIMPTPGAVGLLIEAIAKRDKISVIGVDIGGATTDVFSVFKGKFNRTVSANLGMSYSVSNVLVEATLPNILRWVPIHIDEQELRNRIGNKMIRPTTIPQTLEELQIEQAIAREALRLSLEQHKEFAVELRGVQTERTIADAFRQTSSGQTLVDMMALDLIVGSGGVLSHAPRRHQSVRMMIDAFLPEGVTELAVDSIFMMPHLGVLSTVNPKAATDVFERDCLVRLGSCIAPVGPAKAGQELCLVKMELPGGKRYEEPLLYGEMKLVEVPYGEPIKTTLRPVRHIDVGAGPGIARDVDVAGGLVGIVLDGRGRRPFTIPTDSKARVDKLLQWGKACHEYPADGEDAKYIPGEDH
ncbi:MAG: glutamate mutase L [Deltaproteobacteria bacterium]|nr:glutamate mutase L [Deltaproteobacteria bacterium]